MKREENESLEEYKERRKKNNEWTKFKLKGEIVWESKIDGTYQKKIHRNKKNLIKSNKSK